MTRTQKLKQHFANYGVVYAAGTITTGFLALLTYATYLDVQNYNEQVDAHNDAKKKLDTWTRSEFNAGRIATLLADGTIISIKPEEIKFYS